MRLFLLISYVFFLSCGGEDPSDKASSVTLSPPPSPPGPSNPTGPTNPSGPSPSLPLTGVAIYKANCIVCHSNVKHDRFKKVTDLASLKSALETDKMKSVASSLKTSSPTLADIMAANIPLVGVVTVSLIKLISINQGLKRAIHSYWRPIRYCWRRNYFKVLRRFQEGGIPSE